MDKVAMVSQVIKYFTHAGSVLGILNVNIPITCYTVVPESL